MKKKIYLKRTAVCVVPVLLLIILYIIAKNVFSYITFPPCVFYTHMHFLCPSCGMTRAAIALFNGDLFLSLRSNFMLIGGFMLGFVYYLEYALRVFGKNVNFRIIHSPKVIYGFLIFLGVFYFVRNFIPYIAPI